MNSVWRERTVLVLISLVGRTLNVFWDGLTIWVLRLLTVATITIRHVAILIYLPANLTWIWRNSMLILRGSVLLPWVVLVRRVIRQIRLSDAWSWHWMALVTTTVCTHGLSLWTILHMRVHISHHSLRWLPSWNPRSHIISSHSLAVWVMRGHLVLYTVWLVSHWTSDSSTRRHSMLTLRWRAKLVKTVSTMVHSSAILTSRMLTLQMRHSWHVSS